MDFKDDGSEIDDSLLHPLNAQLSILVTDGGIKISFNDLQNANVLIFIKVIELGRETRVNDKQLLNAFEPISLTPSEISTTLNLGHPRNALSLIFFTVESILISFIS